MRQNLTGDFAAPSKKAEREKVKTTPLRQTQQQFQRISLQACIAWALRKSHQSLLPNTCSALGELPLQVSQWHREGLSLPAGSHTQPRTCPIDGAGDTALPQLRLQPRPLLALSSSSNKVCWKELLSRGPASRSGAAHVLLGSWDLCSEVVKQLLDRQRPSAQLKHCSQHAACLSNNSNPEK